MTNFTEKYLTFSTNESPVVLRGDTPILFRAAPTEITTVDGSQDTFKFVITTNDVDRYGDIVEPSGMDATTYLNNPVVLFNHISSADILPIANALDLTAVNNGIVSTAKFHLDTQLSRECAALLAKGYLRATSIGFSPIEWQDIANENGDRYCNSRRYTKWSLFEYSVVNIPANPYALITNGFVTDFRRAMENGDLANDSDVIKNITRLIANGTPENVRKAIEKELTGTKLNFTIPIKRTIKMLTPEQMAQAVAEVSEGVAKMVVEHLTVNYGVDATEADTIGKLCGETCGTIYNSELGEEDAAEDAPEVPQGASDNPEDMPAQSDAPDEAKAGATYSAATKAKIATINDTAMQLAKLVKAFHAEVHASNETSTETPITKSVEFDAEMPLELAIELGIVPNFD